MSQLEMHFHVKNESEVETNQFANNRDMGRWLPET